MRVLHIMSSEGVYGAERVLLGLLDGLRRVDAAVALFAKHSRAHLSFAAEVRRLGIELIELPDGMGQTIGALRQIRTLACARDIDILQTHGYKENVLGALAVLGLRRPAVVFTQHGFTAKNRKSRLFGRLDRLSARMPTVRRVVCVSQGVADAYRASGVDPSKIIHIRNVVALPPEARRDEAAPAFDFAYIGRLSPEKGPDVLLEALSLMPPPRPRLAFAGTGPQHEALVARAAALGLARSATFLGFIEDPKPLMRSARALVLPSHTEGLPLVVLEALGEAMPVIATAVGEIPALYELADWGELVSPGDAPALAEAMAGAMAGPSRWREKGANGRAMVARHFDRQAWLEAWYTLYQECRSATSVEAVA